MERNDNDQVQLTLRLREQLRQRLEDQARKKKISLNTTIVQRLEQSLSAEDVIPVRLPSSLRARLADSAARRQVSLEEEILLRLLESIFEEAQRTPGGAHIRAAADAITRTLYALEDLTGRKSFGQDGDAWLHEQAWTAINLLFSATRPPGEAVPPRGVIAEAIYQRHPILMPLENFGENTMLRTLNEGGMQRRRTASAEAVDHLLAATIESNQVIEKFVSSITSMDDGARKRLRKMLGIGETEAE
jgi:predicted HicB family RNase H-like nuclease